MGFKQMRRCEVCGEWLEEADFLEETIWDEALTLCEECEEMVNAGVVSHKQIKRGR